MKYIRWLLLKLAYPMLKWLGEIYPERLMTPSFVSDAKNNMRAGDVLITHENMVITNLLIPGYFTHAAIYIGYGMIVEATGIGVHAIPIEKFLYEKDAVTILRPSFADEKQCFDAALFAEQLIGSKYDFSFSSGNKAFYCAELVWYCYDKTINLCPFTMRETLGVLTVTPEDFNKARDKFNVVRRFEAP